MAGAFGFGDDLGPAKIIQVYEPTLGLKAVLVVDNVARGPSIGGLRMAPIFPLRQGPRKRWRKKACSWCRISSPMRAG